MCWMLTHIPRYATIVCDLTIVCMYMLYNGTSISQTPIHHIIINTKNLALLRQFSRLQGKQRKKFVMVYIIYNCTKTHTIVRNGVTSEQQNNTILGGKKFRDFKAGHVKLALQK